MTSDFTLLTGDEAQAHAAGATPIMRALEEKTDGRERILPGTLYAAIARMLDEELIEERNPPKQDTSAGPARRYYRRTARGRAAAREESERLRALLQMAVAQDMVPGIAK